MHSQEDARKIQLDHMIDEKFAEIFFLAKDEFEIGSNTRAERELYDKLEQFREQVKDYCRQHYGEHL